jgi:hypothetical protein
MPTPHQALCATRERSYRLEQRRDYISGFDHRVMLTGQPIGGYAAMTDQEGGKFAHPAHARRAGEIFVETGLLPAFQTDERIAACREAARVVAPKERKAA